ncbi:SDR family oxidoreductase [Erythrobacter sp.]|uniref:SDR family oxidoreductase n=1 Tax=Erythrobacter sp. TaxID=1042 RepID=UPI0025D6B977|nr:SDR family NAD(P)-dependent oxidoreductase [Erythrobacter sp.]
MMLENKVVLVTGGSSGIGAEIARQFRALGNDVVICGRNAEKLAAAAAKLDAHPIRCDVANVDECRQMLDEIDMQFGRLDILVNCAGIMLMYDFHAQADTPDRLQREIEINAIAPLRLTHMALPHMLEGWEPAIVFVSSGLAYIPFPATPVYSGTKALIHHSSMALRHQLEGYGVKVFELLPPVTDTPLAEGMDTGSFKKTPPADVVAELISAMRKDRFEIAAGASKQLRLMSRIAPAFLFRQMVKQFGGGNR